MGKYIIALLIGILIGTALRKLFEKYWMDILIGILYVALFVIIVPLYIIAFPIWIIRAISNQVVTERKIVREYDRIFYEASTMEKVTKINRKIKRYSQVFEYRVRRKKEKENKQMLEEAKWVI